MDNTGRGQGDGGWLVEQDRTLDPDETYRDRRFSLLGDAQRRAAIAALDEEGGPVTLGDLAVAVAGDDSIDRLRVRLHHVHLPKLADVGAIEYDPEAQIAAPTDRLDEFAALLAATGDL